jgi:hypothetical protein
MSGPEYDADLHGEDFESIEAAVMETPRGRWFLAEFARRIRQNESRHLLEAMARLEYVVEESLHTPIQAPPAYAPPAMPAPEGYNDGRRQAFPYNQAPQNQAPLVERREDRARARVERDKSLLLARIETLARSRAPVRPTPDERQPTDPWSQPVPRDQPMPASPPYQRSHYSPSPFASDWRQGDGPPPRRR